jgi:ankyrin repeat protein
VVRTLLIGNADPALSTTDDGSSPLFMAAQNNHTDVVEALLGAQADPNQATTDEVATTPLFMAAQDGHLQIVTALLASKADPALGMVNAGVTPLFMATQDNHLVQCSYQ